MTSIYIYCVSGSGDLLVFIIIFFLSWFTYVVHNGNYLFSSLNSLIAFLVLSLYIHIYSKSSLNRPTIGATLNGPFREVVVREVLL